ncbi:MAG TPA: DEAD/DEAH box helicase, partial [Opitutales bacterium]|nr:DEAD/DEAH box helicase [Opitutales bacterium]
MQLHGPKRVYNASALEFWFDQLTRSWEPHFSGETLKKGRRLYRDGMIRGIELSERDAIIHSKLEGREVYAVIEWQDGKPTTRASVEETSLGRALAVAGLYEIEEMVVDEISPLPAGGAEEEEDEKIDEQPKKPKKKLQQGRPLHLVFQAEPEGLSFKAEWVGEDGERVPALAPGDKQNLLPEERGRIIRLTSLARRGDFQFSQKSHRYLLRDLGRIPGFLKQELQPWRKFFKIELDSSVQNLTKGVREVVVEAHASSRTSGDLNLEWIFRTGEKRFSRAEADKLLKRKGDLFLSPEAGLVQLSPEKVEAVREWQQQVSPRKGETVPRYMLLSLFTENRIELQIDDELDEWRQKLLTPPEPMRALPKFLRNYQREGVEWMAHLFDVDCHALLADEMGLGKTVQVISLFAARPTAEKKHLVVAPASVIPVWEKELARFYPEMKVHILRSGSTFAEEGSDGVWLASYTQLRRHSDLLAETKFGYAVLDEGQMIKNPTAKITRACFSIWARHRLVLTGTPLENRRLDLWSLFHFLMPNLLGTRSAFEKAATVDPEKFLHGLRAQLAPFVLRRTKQKVAKELPPKIEVVLASPLTSRQKDEYVRICREGLNRLGEDLPETMRKESFGVLS